MIEIAVVLLTSLLAVVGYFVHKWIEKVEKWIEVAATQRLEISETVSLVRSEQIKQGQEISSEITRHLTQIKKETPNQLNLSKIETELRGLSTPVNQKVLPALEKQDQNFGKVILIENSLQTYERKLLTMYEAVTQLLRERKDRK